MHVAFLTPTLTRNVASEYAISLRDTQHLLTQSGIIQSYITLGGDPYLDKVRNKLATKVLDEYPTVTDIFWLDDDIGWPPEAALRLLARPEEVVAGIYPKKEPDRLDFPCALRCDAATGAPIIDQGLVAADMVPTGFLRWKRSVLEQMAALRPRYIDVIGGEARQFAEIFRTGPLWDDRMWYGEDTAFCREWRELGGDLWIMPDIAFMHRGTHVWQSTLGEHLNGFIHRPIDQAA